MGCNLILKPYSDINWCEPCGYKDLETQSQIDLSQESLIQACDLA